MMVAMMKIFLLLMVVLNGENIFAADGCNDGNIFSTDGGNDDSFLDQRKSSSGRFYCSSFPFLASSLFLCSFLIKLSSLSSSSPYSSTYIQKAGDPGDISPPIFWIFRHFFLLRTRNHLSLHCV